MEQLLAKINKLTPWQVAIIIAAVGIAVFSTGLTNPFIGDDLYQIVNNIPVHSIRNTPLFFESSTFYNGQGFAPLIGIYYRPLMVTAFSLVYTIFGPHTIYFHFLQIMFVIASAIILYLVFERMFNSLLALVLALVFLVHPMNSQVAFAIPTLQDALFFFFGILAFYFLIRFSSIKSLWLVVACLFLSLLSKEAGALFVVVSSLYLLWSERKRLWPFISMLVLPTVVYLVLKIHAVGLSGHPNLAPLDRISLVGRLLTAPSILLFYVSKFTFPFKLSSGYYWAYPNITVRHTLLPLILDIAVIASIVYLVYLIRKRVSAEQHAAFIFFALWSATGLVPYLQIVPLDMTASVTWFYFSMVGVLGMIGILLVAFQDYIRPNLFIAVVAVVICILGIRTIFRGTEWGNKYTLAKHDIAASKEDYVAYYLLAEAFSKRGDYRQAKVYATQSVNIFPAFTNYNDLGVISANLGEYAEAAKAYNNGLKYGAATSTIYENMGDLALVYGDPTVSKQNILGALHRFPHDFYLCVDLAILEDQNGDNSDAKVAIAHAASYGRVPQFIYDGIMTNRPFEFNLSNINANVTVR